VQGEILGAIVIDRTVLEWRLDPTSPSRIEQAIDHQVRVIVVCAEGYSSSLAAASLQDIGLVNATDLMGGFEAWKAAGLPIDLRRDRREVS
jgi:rhodanese-related sulfurtransferase